MELAKSLSKVYKRTKKVSELGEVWDLIRSLMSARHIHDLGTDEFLDEQKEEILIYLAFALEPVLVERSRNCVEIPFHVKVRGPNTTQSLGVVYLPHNYDTLQPSTYHAIPYALRSPQFSVVRRLWTLQAASSTESSEGVSWKLLRKSFLFCAKSFDEESDGIRLRHGQQVFGAGYDPSADSGESNGAGTTIVD